MAWSRRSRYSRSSYVSGYRKGLINSLRGTDLNKSIFGESRALANPLQKKYRSAFGYRGSGLYEGRGAYSWKKFGRDIMKYGAPMAKAALLASPAAPLVGAASQILGRGSYQMNEVMADSSLSSPSVVSTGDEAGCIVISNREYVGDIFAPSSGNVFKNSSFYLNPGLEATFPWLSQLAANYEEYEFIQLVFEFRSVVDQVSSSTGQVGTVVAVCNYNPTLPPFTDKSSMISYYGSVSARTVDPLICGVECDPSKLSGSPGHYVRTNPVLQNEDLKTYDHGLFQLATSNVPTAMINGTLGELYVAYTVKLRKPKLYVSRGLSITRALFVSGGSESTSFLMGTQALLLRGQQNNIPVLCTVASNQILLTFPAFYAGNLSVRLYVEGTGITSGVVTDLKGGQVVGISDIYASTGVAGDSPGNSTGNISNTGGVLEWHINVSTALGGVNNTLLLQTGSFVATSVTQSAIDICEYNTSFNNNSDSIIGGGAPILVNASNIVVVP